MAKRVAIYTRVSTDGQTTDNQLREIEAVAERQGWEIVRVFTDNGISGANGRELRPAFDALIKGAIRRDFDLIANVQPYLHNVCSRLINKVCRLRVAPDVGRGDHVDVPRLSQRSAHDHDFLYRGGYFGFEAYG